VLLAADSVFMVKKWSRSVRMSTREMLSPHVLPAPQKTDSPEPPLSLSIVLGLSGAVLLLHTLLSGRYGYFRDELYYLSCGHHLAWGYVDMPPMIALIARMALVLGGSLRVLRIIAGIGGAGIVAITVLIAWRLGGGRFAQGLAGLCALIVPEYLVTGGLFSMNLFEKLFWMGCVYVLIRIIQTGDSRLWIGFGVLAGLGMMNKHSMLFFGFAVLLGLILTQSRKEFAKPWIWIGGLIAVLIFLPNLIWQAQHHFPTIDDLHNIRATGKNVVLGPVAFVREQILMMHPILLPVWLAGLWFVLAGKGVRYRLLGWTYLILLVMFIVLHGKDYYLAPAYPMLLASGAVASENWLDITPTSRGRFWPKAAIVIAIAVAGAVTAPLALPLLSPAGYVAYQQKLHIRTRKTEVHHDGPLPQFLGDQFGWPELTADVARVYNSLPSEERRNTGILAGNFGEASAIDMFGPRYGLPAAMSGNLNYYYWGTRGFTGDNVITVHYGSRYLNKICRSTERVGEHTNPWGMEEENYAIVFCHGLKEPLTTIWKDQKNWN
jgi:hypothetical protein